MLKIVRNFPKPLVGGWHLQAHGQTFAGSTPDGVIEQLTRYRGANSLPLGQPEHELAESIRERAPHLVRDTAYIPGEFQRVAENTMAVHYGRLPLLPINSERIGERRARCATCLARRTAPAEQPGYYWNAALARAALIAGDPEPLKFGWCAHHHWLVAVAARLEQPASLGLPEAPANCFVR